MAENTSRVRSDNQSTNLEVAENSENPGSTCDAIAKAQKEQVCTDNEDIRARIAVLETERIKKATQEIHAILDKYGVVLQAVAVIPASRINVVSRLND
jgi:hypothetical protein